MRYNNHSYHNIAIHFSIPSIKSLHTLNDCKFVWKIVNEFVDCPILKLVFSSRSTPAHRSTRIFNEPIFTTNYCFYSTIPRLRRLWNSLDSQTRDIKDINEFLDQIRPLILSFY